MKKTQRRRRARGGFSLAEMLVTLIILSLLSSAAALGATQALWQRSQSIALADAQTVASTAAQVVTDQLRYGRIARVEGDGAIVLFSGVYQMPVALGLDGQGRLITRSVSSTGDVLADTDQALLGADAYCALQLSGLEFHVNKSGESVDSVTVSLDVTKAGETEGLWSLEFSVVPMDRRTFSF